MSYSEIEMKVVQWGEKRGIVQNSTPAAQAIKTQEELDELIDAIRNNDKAAMADAYGDILVTLVMGCACADLDLVTCFEGAYNEIKDRKGFLNKDGIFVKEVLWFPKDAWRRFVVGLHMESAGTTPVRQHPQGWDSRCSPFFLGKKWR